MEADRDRKAGEDEARRVIEGVADPFEIAERPEDQALHGGKRILADRQHDKAGDDEGGADVDERDQRDVRPGGQRLEGRAHAARSLTPAIRRPRSCAFVSSGRRSPVIRPLQSTMMRSESAKISSSSTDTKSTALPSVALGDDALVDEFDRADVDAAGRLPDQQDLGIALDLARQHDLLLVAAGEIGGLEQGRARADVERLHLLLGVGHDGAAPVEETLAVDRLAMKAEHRAFAGFERHDEPDAMAILRHMPHAE